MISSKQITRGSSNCVISFPELSVICISTMALLNVSLVCWFNGSSDTRTWTFNWSLSVFELGKKIIPISLFPEARIGISEKLSSSNDIIVVVAVLKVQLRHPGLTLCEICNEDDNDELLGGEFDRDDELDLELATGAKILNIGVSVTCSGIVLLEVLVCVFDCEGEIEDVKVNVFVADRVLIIVNVFDGVFDTLDELVEESVIVDDLVEENEGFIVVLVVGLVVRVLEVENNWLSVTVDVGVILLVILEVTLVVLVAVKVIVEVEVLLVAGVGVKDGNWVLDCVFDTVADMEVPKGIVSELDGSMVIESGVGDKVVEPVPGNSWLLDTEIDRDPVELKKGVFVVGGKFVLELLTDTNIADGVRFVKVGVFVFVPDIDGVGVGVFVCVLVFDGDDVLVPVLVTVFVPVGDCDEVALLDGVNVLVVLWVFDGVGVDVFVFVLDGEFVGDSLFDDVGVFDDVLVALVVCVWDDVGDFVGVFVLVCVRESVDSGVFVLDSVDGFEGVAVFDGVWVFERVGELVDVLVLVKVGDGVFDEVFVLVGVGVFVAEPDAGEIDGVGELVTVAVGQSP